MIKRRRIRLEALVGSRWQARHGRVVVRIVSGRRCVDQKPNRSSRGWWECRLIPTRREGNRCRYASGQDRGRALVLYEGEMEAEGCSRCFGKVCPWLEAVARSRVMLWPGRQEWCKRRSSKDVDLSFMCNSSGCDLDSDDISSHGLPEAA